jgi:hypothetical protein
MSIVSTKTHAILDYTAGVLLVAAPLIFEFHNGTAAHWIPIINGVAVLLLSVITNYEGGIFRFISMRTHLTIDVVAGIGLALSPWIFGFSNTVFLPHLMLGLFEIAAGLATDRMPFPLGKELFTRTAHHH